MRPRELFRLCFVHPVMKYVTGLVAILAGVLVRYELSPHLHDQSHYLLVFPVMIVWAIYGGLGPGILCAIVGTFATFAIIVRPFESAGLHTADLNALIVHCLMCVGFLWVIEREVSEKQRREDTEQKLEHLNQELEMKVAERTVELKAANAELENFCYSVAHDLRTPGRAIAGNARILIEDHAQALTPDLRAHLFRISGAATKLGNLIDALLLYARLAQQELRREELPVHTLLTEIARADAAAEGVELRLDIEDGLILYADERQMKVLLGALVRNAIVYRKPDAPVVIRLRKDGETLIFADEGIGFEMTYRSKVFMPFERLHRDEAYPGVGMGLANVARVVARHGGEAYIDSVPGDGTSVRLAIPGLVKQARQLAGAAAGVR